MEAKRSFPHKSQKNKKIKTENIRIKSKSRFLQFLSHCDKTKTTPPDQKKNPLYERCVVINSEAISSMLFSLMALITLITFREQISFTSCNRSKKCYIRLYLINTQKHSSEENEDLQRFIIKGHYFNNCIYTDENIIMPD